MKLTIEIPDYDGQGMDVIWKKGGKFKLNIENNCVILSANKIAMLSIAEQLLYFVNNELPCGSHVHFDSFFCQGLEDGAELTIEEIL